MERLVADAAKIDSSIDANSLSFGNVVAAINVVQKEMGIYGTTALEAEKTISGSLNAMKGAWGNLITGIADDNADFDVLINNMVESVGTFGGNILPRIEVALDGAVKLIEGIFPKIIEMLPNLFTTLLPSIVTGAINIVQSLVNSLSANSNLLMSSAVDMIMTLVNGLLGMLPDIIKLGLDLIVSLALGIADALPELIPTIVDVIMQIVNTLTDPEVLGNLIDAAIAIIMGLADGLIEALPVLIEAIPTIINNLIDAIIENLPKIIAMGVELTMKLQWGIIKAIPDLVRAIPELFIALVKAIVGQYVVLFNTGKEIIGKLLEGIKNAWEDVKNWFSNAWDNLFGGRKVEIDAEVNEETDGSHRNGLRYVPYDGYVAELHKGERVLTAEESRAYNEGRNISVVQNIYSSAKTAADLMREAKWEQDRAVFGLV